MLPIDYPDQFYVDLAIGTNTFEDTCHMHGLVPEDVEAREEDPEFKRRLLIAQQATETTGDTLAARCRVLVTRRVNKVEEMMLDPEVPASTRLEAFKTLAKFGRLEPEKRSDPVHQEGPQLVLNIIAPDGTPAVTIDQVPSRPAKQDDEVLPLAPPSSVQGFF